MFVVKAEYITGHKIRVSFNDGKIVTIDLFNFLNKSKNHLINKYINVELFKDFCVEDGTICWGENDFDLDPANIYNGVYSKPKRMVLKSTKQKSITA